MASLVQRLPARHSQVRCALPRYRCILICLTSELIVLYASVRLNRQLATVHQGADVRARASEVCCYVSNSPAPQVQVGSITINSLPPTSKQPLVVRPFQPASAFVQSLSLLHNVKGKARESTSDIDYALLEGLVVAATASLGQSIVRLRDMADGFKSDT